MEPPSDTEAELLVALWLGLPGDPDARDLARRLARINQMDELARHRIRKELNACLDDMLCDDRDAAVA